MDSTTPSHPTRLVITSGVPRAQTMSSFANNPTIINGFPVTIATPSSSSGQGAQYFLLDPSASSAVASSSGSGRANYVKMVSAASRGSSTMGGNVLTLTPVPKPATIILNHQNGIRQAGGGGGNMYRNSSTNLPRTIKVVAQSSSSRPPPQNGPTYRSIMNESKPVSLRTVKATAPIPKGPKPSTSQLKHNPPKPLRPAPKPAIKKKPIKKKPRGRKRDNTMQDNFTTEMNELRSKIQSRFDSKRKLAVKKEDVGYEGPYIKSYHLPDTEGQTPVLNFIVDDLEAHVIPTGTNRHRLKLDKPTGMAGTETVLTCAFCHLDPAGERETGMGDLIGPMLVPAEVRWNRKPGEDKAFVYVHSKCLEWSSNFRMIGFELAEPRALFEDCKNTCDICTRRGATIGCSGPRCTKAFHFPCAQLQGLKMIRGSHQIYCDSHQNAVMRKRKPNEEA